MVLRVYSLDQLYRYHLGACWTGSSQGHLQTYGIRKWRGAQKSVLSQALWRPSSLLKLEKYLDEAENWYVQAESGLQMFGLASMMAENFEIRAEHLQFWRYHLKPQLPASLSAGVVTTPKLSLHPPAALSSSCSHCIAPRKLCLFPSPVLPW